MKINELKLVYFSPTGSTRKIIMETARSIELKSVSFDLSVYKEKKPVLKFGANDFVLFGIPVYYGRVPALFMEYLENISGDNTPAALVATYGCRQYEDALLELKNAAEKRGFKIIGAAAFPAEHSIVPVIGARRPGKADLKTAAEYGTELNRRLRKENDFSGLNLMVPGNTPYRKYGKNSLFPKADTSLCTECGACAKVCPRGRYLHLRSEEDRPQKMYRLHEMRADLQTEGKECKLTENGSGRTETVKSMPERQRAGNLSVKTDCLQLFSALTFSVGSRPEAAGN